MKTKDSNNSAWPAIMFLFFCFAIWVAGVIVTVVLDRNNGPKQVFGGNGCLCRPESHRDLQVGQFR